MLAGVVPFKGTNQNKVYVDIKERNIQWPPTDEINDIMSPVAQDLINRMLQLVPENRLGHDLASLEILKAHPFFKGIDFEEVSKKKFKGVYQLL